MRSALVVYESLFGDARAIATAVAQGLSETIPAGVVAADAAPAEVGPEVALLVVGGPTHGFGMPKQATREGAEKQYGVHVDDPSTGLREWLASVRLPAGIAAVAFDTRMDHPKLLVTMDHASRQEEKLLEQRGAVLLADAEHFRVTDARGPLAEGEEARALRWGAELGRTLSERLTRA
ncbi:hypothetical protein ACI8AF_05950 [Blastococcus sp. SYSU D00669]